MFLFTFIVTLIATAVITYFWNLIFHGYGLVEWETSFRSAILFGILFALLKLQDNKKDKKQ